MGRFKTLDEAVEELGSSKLLKKLNRAILETKGFDRSKEAEKRKQALGTNSRVEFSPSGSMSSYQPPEASGLCRPWLLEGRTGTVVEVLEHEVVVVLFDGATDFDYVSRSLLLWTDQTEECPKRMGSTECVTLESLKIA